MPGESIVASDNITVKAIWKEKTPPPALASVKVNVTFNGNTGSGSMPAVEVEKGSNYTLPVCSFTAPADKEFDKWSVTVTGFPAVDKMLLPNGFVLGRNFICAAFYSSLL